MNVNEVKSRLKEFPQDKVLSILAKAYFRDEKTRREVDILFQSVKSGDVLLDELKKQLDMIEYHPAAFFKDQLAAYVKVEKDKRKRIEAYYLFIEAALDGYAEKRCDHRMVMAASGLYGKALDMMDREIWREYFERTYNIASKFHETPGEASGQAVWYYQERKNLIGGDC